jgi:uncharacterized damage-inducible protein DinB
MLLIARPAPDEFAPYYARYIDLVPDDLLRALRENGEETRRRLSSLTDAKADFRYAPGKWSVKEVVGHITDAERIFTYRALRFARADETPLPGFDENSYVEESRFSERALSSLLDEFRVARAASIAFFENLDETAWNRAGLANDVRMSVRAIAFAIAGHELHHRKILVERYGV